MTRSRTPQLSAPFTHIGRREMLRAVAATAAAAGTTQWAQSGFAAAPQTSSPGATKGRIQQSIVSWCFEPYWKPEALCRVATQLGCKSIELIAPEYWPLLKKHGLCCALASSHGFDKGMNNPRYQPQCLAKMRAAIDACSEFGFPNVITFTGFRAEISDDVGMDNCVRGYKEIVGYAEKKRVTLCLEMLNSRVAIEMKGHPGYQGDHTDYCMEIIKRVGSPRLKLLFDIYHVQVMDGDIIHRIRQCRDSIGHYHTAGNPGRGELDDRQEINYRPIIEEIARSGFDGYVAQEFIPTGDPLAGLRAAVELCDV